MSTKTDKSQDIQRNKRVWPIKRNKSTENVPEKIQRSDLLDKDFKTALKMLTEPKEGSNQEKSGESSKQKKLGNNISINCCVREECYP